MKKSASLTFCLVIMSIFSFLPAFAQEGGDMKALMIIAPNDFRDEDFFEPKKILEQGGAKVTVASRTLSSVKGMLGGITTPNVKIDEVKAVDFDAIIFVGGAGARCYWNDPVAHKIISDAVLLNKIVAAICIAPVTLANTGILKNKKVTVWPSESQTIELKGGVYTGNPVEKDGNIITASGPAAAKDFGREILNSLTKE